MKLTIILSIICSGIAEYPWTFDNDLFGGPDFWGLVNKHWRMCTAGQLQSPINIDPSVLLYDPGLTPIEIDKRLIDVTFDNMGQLPLLTVNDSIIEANNINISGGPIFPYRYRLRHITAHFGESRREENGSEHTIDKVRFPAEIQLLAYNTDLYDNFSAAMTQPRGLLAISIIVDIGGATNPELKKLTVASQNIICKGSRTVIKKFNPSAIMPSTKYYVTYSGSLTFPGCYETVTWVIMNNPIYITKKDLNTWSELQQTESKQSNPVLMVPNYRPLKPLNGRLIRTNINTKFKPSSSQTCASNLYIDMGYKANPKRVSSSVSKHRKSLHDVKFMELESLNTYDTGYS